MTAPKRDGCRVCGSDERLIRGLCQKHYRRWKAKYDELPTQEERDAFEEECIAKGWITPKSKGGRPKEDPDPFDEIAAEIEQRLKQQDAKEVAASSPKRKRKSG